MGLERAQGGGDGVVGLGSRQSGIVRASGVTTPSRSGSFSARSLRVSRNQMNRPSSWYRTSKVLSSSRRSTWTTFPYSATMLSSARARASGSGSATVRPSRTGAG
ncbi:hypothetical protein ACFQY7_43415 [Actinomadura luteofluorescens]|uniref:hypothetical protein n=1 Tax=Actinomadura luteofluorescens TaxID=46163 RepID=UPI00362EB75B